MEPRLSPRYGYKPANAWECCNDDCKSTNLIALYPRDCPLCGQRKCSHCNYIFVSPTGHGPSAVSNRALLVSLASSPQRSNTPMQRASKNTSIDHTTQETVNSSAAEARADTGDTLSPTSLNSENLETPQTNPSTAWEARSLPFRSKQFSTERPSSSKTASTGRDSTESKLTDVSDLASAGTERPPRERSGWTSRWLNNGRRVIREPPLPPGMVRIRFLCPCRTMVWDDYPEYMADAARDLEAEVNKYFREMAPPASRAPQDRGGWRASLFNITATGSLSVPFVRIFNWERHQRRDRDIELESQARPGPSNVARSRAFYLTCATRGARIPALLQPPAESISTDLEYFDLLRKIVNDHARTLKGILNPRKVTSIEYVKFELLFDNEHVEIRQRPGYPESKEHYQPCKDDFDTDCLRPWGPNTLLHYFERRHKCLEHPRILARIPKKLKEKLAVSDDGKLLMGWGMQLIDGVDGFRIGILGIIGLVMSSLVGVLWAKLHGNDIQGGTGLTQCLMAFVTFLVTMHGLVGFVEQKQ